MTVKVGSNAGENAGCAGGTIGRWDDDGRRGVIWPIEMPECNTEGCGEGDDVIEPEALDGTDGKGKFGGGFLAGSTRRNLRLQWFKLVNRPTGLVAASLLGGSPGTSFWLSWRARHVWEFPSGSHG